jgi:enoyl-CoA hydratase
MSSPVTVTRAGQVTRIVMDDGKVNVMSLGMLNALHAALDQAEKDRTVVLLTARGKCFSAGFDLKTFATASAGDILAMLKSGAQLPLRLLSFPTPVVAACNGHAYPEGAFLLMSADYRLGAEGPFKIGMNEVTIGLPLPHWAIEVARQRLSPAYFSRALMTGEMFGPAEAVTAGFLDRVVPASELDAAAGEVAERLSAIDFAAHAQTKALARAPVLQAIRAAISEELTLERIEKMVAKRL